jgi:HK97 family phage portal protein
MNPWKWLTGRGTEQRSADAFTYASPGGWVGSHGVGEHVSVIRAENLATVQACVGVISSTIASLPARVYQIRGNDRIEISGGPYAGLLANPYSTLTWSEWVEWLASQTLLHGNSVCEIIYDSTGTVTALRPLPWERVTPLRVLNNPAAGRLLFGVSMPNEPYRQLLDSQVMHVRDRSDDGLLGRSRISRSPGAIRNAEELQNFSLAGWDNQATPAVAVTAGKKPGPDGFKRMKAQFDERYAGTKNARKTVFLDEGSTVTPLSVSPEDAQILESRRFSVEEICRLFNVPPPLAQDYTRNTFSNAATAGLWFAQFTLLPWVRKIEAAFKLSVFGPNSGLELELDMSGLTRGDYATRWTSYATARGSQILTVDEIRAQEGYSPLATSGAPVPEESGSADA